MQHVQNLLQELDQLYHSDTLAEYETKWQIATKLVEQELPGLTIAYAEICNSGIARLPDGKMRHVLVPQI